MFSFTEIQRACLQHLAERGDAGDSLDEGRYRAQTFRALERRRLAMWVHDHGGDKGSICSDPRCDSWRPGSWRWLITAAGKRELERDPRSYVQTEAGVVRESNHVRIHLVLDCGFVLSREVGPHHNPIVRRFAEDLARRVEAAGRRASAAARRRRR